MDHSVRRKKKEQYWINSKSEQHITAQSPQSSRSCAPWGQACTFLPAEQRNKKKIIRLDTNILQQKAFRGSKICLAGPQEVKIRSGIKGRDGENGSGNYGISPCKHTVSRRAVAWAYPSARFTFRWQRRRRQHSRLHGLKGSVPQ